MEHFLPELAGLVAGITGCTVVENISEGVQPR